MHTRENGCTTQIHGILAGTTPLSPRLSRAYRSIQAMVSGAPNPPQWRPSSFSFFWPFTPLNSSSFHLPSPYRRLFTPHEISDRRISPPFTLRSSHCPHTIHPSVGTDPSTRDTLPTTPRASASWRIVHHLPSLSTILHYPLVSRTTTDRLRRPRRQRYNRLTHLTDEREEKRAHTLRAYGRPSTTDLENFVVLGPGSLSRSFAGDDPDRSRSMSRTTHHEERYTRVMGNNALRAIRTNRSTPSFESNSSGSSRRR